MIRNCFLLLNCLLACLIVHAQDYTRPEPEPTSFTKNSGKFSIGVSIGPAIPIQDFGSHNVSGSFWDFHSPDSTRLQGFAKTGFHFDVTACYMLSDDFGIELMVGGNNNPVDINAFEATMGYPATSSFTSYYTGEYLIGAYLSFPLGISGKFKITGAALAGLVNNNYPTLSLAFNDTTTYTRNIANGKYVFGYSLNVGLAYNITDNMDLLLNVGYTGATITYPNWVESQNTLVPSLNGIIIQNYNHTNDQTSMVTGIIKPTIGVVFRF